MVVFFVLVVVVLVGFGWVGLGLEPPPMLEACVEAWPWPAAGVEAVKGRHASLLQSGNVNFAIYGLSVV